MFFFSKLMFFLLFFFILTQITQDFSKSACFDFQPQCKCTVIKDIKGGEKMTPQAALWNIFTCFYFGKERESTLHANHTVYLNGLYVPFSSPLCVLQPLPIPWVLCCSPSFPGRRNTYTQQHHRGSNVCVLEEGKEWQLTYVGTPEQELLSPLLAHGDTQGWIWPPAVWRGWLVHLRSCRARLHAGDDTPAWQYASARPRRLPYGNLPPPPEKGEEAGRAVG